MAPWSYLWSKSKSDDKGGASPDASTTDASAGTKPCVEIQRADSGAAAVAATGNATADVNSKDKDKLNKDKLNTDKDKGTDTDKDKDKRKREARAWVRAPDLSPNTSVPAEVRVSVRGERKDQVKACAVGLRFRERTVYKARAEGVDPSRYPKNPSRDMHTIGGSNYEQQMAKYHEALADPTLWNQGAAERIVFDSTLDLPFEPAAWEGQECIDFVQSFAVHVPNTNFPPQMRMGMSGFRMDLPGVMMYDESQFEYYVTLALADGDVLTVPAGTVGFLPAAEPVASKDRPMQKTPFPQSVDLLDYGRTIKPRDVQNDAKLSISVAAPSRPLLQGSEWPMDVTLKYTAAPGSAACPRFVDFEPTGRSFNHWVRECVESDETFDLLSGLNFFSADMLMVRSDAALRREADMNERRPDASCEPWLNPGVVRFKLPEDLPDDGVYRFTVNFPIPENALPTFQRTFVTLGYWLEIKVFVSDDKPKEAGAAPAAQTISDARDAEWVEYQLPPKTERPSFKYFTGKLPYDVAVSPSPNASAADVPVPVHYTEPQALGPALAFPTDTAKESIQYPPLGTVQLEESSGPGRSRFRHNWPKFRPEGNPGGAHKHAAKMWQKREALSRAAGEP